MDAIKSAIDSLHNKSNSGDDEHRDVKIALTHLRSTIELLELQTLSPNAIGKLSNLLRPSLLPLYRNAFPSTLKVVAAVFRFIHRNKILPSLESKFPIHAWETILLSLISGILDFFEEFIDVEKALNSEYRKSMGLAIFPMLCPVFFCPLSGNYIFFDGDLSSAVYQLLMTIVTLYPPDATRLRDEIGSKRLGITISQTKEFLVLESLLELFAVLIPSAQGGREKRRNFIATVFDSSIFSCSGRIIQCLESLTSPDWNITSAEIVQALADSDIAFPQPFDIKNLTVNAELLHQASSFHIDKSQFIANLEEDGKIETLHIPFSTIRKISSSHPNDNDTDVHIVVKINRPVILGGKPFESTSVGEMSVSLDLKKGLLRKFQNILKNRNLSISTVVARKQSLSKEINLDFDTINRKPGILKQEKVQSLSQLWENDIVATGNEASAHCITSSLVSPSAASKVTDVIPPSMAEPGVNLTRNNQEPYHDSDGLSGSDQSPDENSQAQSKSAKPPQRFISSDGRGSPAISRERLQSSNLINRRVVDIKKSMEEALLESLPTDSKIGDYEQKHADSIPVTRKSKKRHTEDVGPDINERTNRNVKRLRRDHHNMHLPSIATTRPEMEIEARSQLRASFDELPQSEAARPPIRFSRFGLTGMKDRTGKLTPKAKRVVVKSSENTNGGRMDPDATLVDAGDKLVTYIAKSTVGESEDVNKRRRSARVAKKLVLSSKEDGVEQKQSASKKARKAPWEEREISKGKPELAVMRPVSQEESPKSEDVSNESAQSRGPLHQDESMRDQSVPYSENYTDFVVPLKSASSSSNHSPEYPDTNIVTIDLTLDDCPETQPVSRKVVTSAENSASRITSKHKYSVQLDATNGTTTSRFTEGKSRPGNFTSPLDAGGTKHLCSQPEGEEGPWSMNVGSTFFSPSAKEGEGRQEQSDPRYADRSLKDAFLSPLSSAEFKHMPGVGFMLPQSAIISHRTEVNSEQAGRTSRTRASCQQKHYKGTQNPGSTNEPEAPLERIVRAVIDKVCRRFNGVADELHSGQRVILEATACIAKEMCNTSARHFNDMIDLEAEYTNQREKITRNIHDYLKATEQLSLCFKDVFNQHNRRSLSRKFPTKLFDEVPVIIKEPKLNF